MATRERSSHIITTTKRRTFITSTTKRFAGRLNCGKEEETLDHILLVVYPNVTRDALRIQVSDRVNMEDILSKKRFWIFTEALCKGLQDMTLLDAARPALNGNRFTFLAEVFNVFRHIIILTIFVFP